MQYDESVLMKKYIYLIAQLLILFLTPVFAIQVSDISPEITRSQADRTLPKNYSYQVLDDFTVRRTWVLSSNQKLSLDFNPTNDQLLMVMLEYGSGTDQQKAANDVRRITGAGKTKWKRMDKKKAEKYDVPVNSLNAKSGSCYAFMQMSKSNKCTRVMLYTSLPNSNRANLGVADTSSNHETALGVRAGASIGKVIDQQEANRKNTPLADTSLVNSSQRNSTPDAISNLNDNKHHKKSQTQKNVFVSSSTVTASDKEVDEEKIIDDFEEVKVESRFSLSAIQASIGLQGVSPTMLIAGAVVVVVLLTLIGMMRSSGERKHLSRYRSRKY